MTHNISKMKETIRLLLKIARFCINMQAQLSKGKGPDPAETKLPATEFVNAWFVLFICLLHLTDEMVGIARKKATKCERCLRRAMEITTTKFQGKPLPQLRAPVPSELSVLFAYRVLQDMTGDMPAVSNTYWNYFTQLVGCISNLKYLRLIDAYSDILSPERPNEKRTSSEVPCTLRRIGYHSESIRRTAGYHQKTSRRSTFSTPP